MDNKN